MQSAAEIAWLIPLLPLLGALASGLGLIGFNKAMNGFKKPVAIILLTCVGVSAVLSYAVLFEQISSPHSVEHLFIWASAGDFTLPMGYVVDPLGAVMLALVTTIALLVMVYSHGYMSHDKGYVRFFTYLALFSSSMLGLIISPNLLEIYVFWELVGMCSYLLVGFWYDRDGAAHAAQKAFVVNRVGDFGLLLGILGLFWATGTFDFNGIAVGLSNAIEVGSVPLWAALLLCFLVFLGPMAKSAQFPLHVWLPDAMEGPTPISALIHAATMVAAGVFLVARLEPLYSQFPFINLLIAIFGTITCFLGASIALTQMDLKKGLAYSTVSQLGYMMLAMGCGAPIAGMFHLVTHAFFKAMLFLGSGSVIHAMEEVVGHEPILAQDMRLMGGLRKKMPITSITFLIGCIAISGIPPLAGFWSKDEILGQAFNTFPILWIVGFLTAGMTAFYMFRLYFLTFEGSFRGHNEELQNILLASAGKEKDEEEIHGLGDIHESSWSMTTPLIVLAVPSVLIGFLGTPWNSTFANLLNSEEAKEMASHFSWSEFLPLALASVAISACGISLAFFSYYSKKIDINALFAGRFPALNAFFANKWYLDDINEKLFVRGSRKLAREVLEVDAKVVDGVVNLTGLLTLGSGEGLKYFETGRAQFYALIVFGGVIALVALFGVLGN
ncbi:MULTISPECIES: NAD(P)H-quinone oxidoreductase subunit 5 [Prochlorococcus]|uniref:NAD(P)H-quinone oxidoreductase chain 5 n=1 Tax=Prochlorococcus marinus (strain SARG / CCMP1375 / SS120) TaxID=167539 RepID=Q7VE42_PROMA|nr:MULTISPECIES: NAD(P)H-quinone oxidoreductase subunit 5 [Prochlorococcus]AAP99218.1 NAD(P)H-quinone oxidoreductase chain 5 [Prochlorococcus marinus subsp. marinus str. CCMP1375]KGG11514.1 NADH dehydrogenase subunit 5 [Prochlorococcus marinus str. LG]KGG18532.1 NADH dehydrogenase subunit 5 [Prochlorococcus marinus str. SS2]KGG22805.1 NADH dehydrogenase subunit 5 [Prochlorococcus marinus str. SS35]KGG32682.1 NADH dehydrogenase subunit 5 [Prochlorococcus marinus str. SS51]